MKYKYNVLISDIETNAIDNWQTLEGLKKIHCLTVIDPTTNDLYEFNTEKDNVREGLRMLQNSEYVCFHNGIGFDAPAIHKLYGIRLNKLIDTMLMGKVLFPDISDYDSKRGDAFPKKLRGSHSLKAWGLRIGVHKDEHGESEDWENFSREMQVYCNQDVRTTFALYKHLLQHSVSPKALVLEHEFAKIVRVQEMNGFPFDVKKAEELAKELNVKSAKIEKKMQEIFAPKIQEMKKPKGWTVEVEGFEYTAKTKLELKGQLRKAGLKQNISDLATKLENNVKVIPFNPNSTQQLAERFMADGWVPKYFTENGKPIIDDKVLRSINTPESLMAAEYKMLRKRLSQLADGGFGFLKVVQDSGRIHGSVNTVGTITARCTHNSPNLAQIPSTRVDYGEQFRELFKAPSGKVLVGCDLAQIELRCLAHYLQPYDSGKYIREILEGDIHEANRIASGLEKRSDAKVFIYALNYGAGDMLLGEIVNGGVKEGKALRARFMSKMPAFAKLLKDLKTQIDKKGFLTGIDGRKLKFKAHHVLLNYLLQSCGSLAMKQAVVEFALAARHPYEIHANVHDEVQFSCLEEHSKDLGRTFVASIEKAGKTLGIKCPLDGEFKIGKNWAETH